MGVFKAKTEEEAIEKASRNCFVSLCHQCSDECEDAEIHNFDVVEVKEQQAKEGEA